MHIDRRKPENFMIKDNRLVCKGAVEQGKQWDLAGRSC